MRRPPPQAAGLFGISPDADSANVLTEETQNLAFLGVSVYGIFGKDEISVHYHIKNARCAWDERQFLDDVLVVLDQVRCRAHGAVRVVSRHAVLY